MFRVAHMNRDKTKLLVKTTDSGDPPEGTVCRPPRYNPHQILEKPKVRVRKFTTLARMEYTLAATTATAAKT